MKDLGRNQWVLASLNQPQKTVSSQIANQKVNVNAKLLSNSSWRKTDSQLWWKAGCIGEETAVYVPFLPFFPEKPTGISSSSSSSFRLGFIVSNCLGEGTKKWLFFFPSQHSLGILSFKCHHWGFRECAKKHSRLPHYLPGCPQLLVMESSGACRCLLQAQVGSKKVIDDSNPLPGEHRCSALLSISVSAPLTKAELCRD